MASKANRQSVIKSGVGRNVRQVERGGVHLGVRP